MKEIKWFYKSFDELLDEYKEHMKHLQRKYKEKENGN